MNIAGLGSPHHSLARNQRKTPDSGLKPKTPLDSFRPTNDPDAPIEVPPHNPDQTIEQLASQLHTSWQERITEPRCTVGILCERGWKPETDSDPVLQIADSIMDSGGLPRLLYVGETPEIQMQGLNALAIPGGRDVEPSFYGQERGPGMATSEPDPEFDAFEIACIREAFEHGMPMLGHCRGEQIMNVAAGGTLIQDIPTEFESPEGWGSKYGTRVNHRPEEVRGHYHKRVDPVHLLVIDENSRLHDIVGDSLEAVNSIHHQAIDQVAPILTPVAWSPDGLVEGVERKGMPWQSAYQFHPESLRHTDSAYQQMYENLVSDGERFRNKELPIPEGAQLPW